MYLDHLAIVAENLEDGARIIEDLLGVTLHPGGKHPMMGTHNKLLSLGPNTYLEVIAVDPDAADPGRARWFGMDQFSGAPRLMNWVARCDDLRGQLGQAPMGMGEILAFERGDLKWSMAVPRGGQLPGDNVLPALMQWTGARPHADLPDSGCKMKRLVLRHPEMDRLAAEWPALVQTDLVAVEIGPNPAIEAEIVTPRGLVALSSLVDPG